MFVHVKVRACGKGQPLANRIEKTRSAEDAEDCVFGLVVGRSGSMAMPRVGWSRYWARSQVWWHS